MNAEQFNKMKSGLGFVAALDQSGGSTPKALKLYGLDESHYSNDAEMYDLIHQMRTRIIKSPAFTSDKILAAILFEMTMNRNIDGVGVAEYLWQEKGIVPILKIDNGLLEEANGVQLMRAIPELDDRLSSAKDHGVFGTKMRSVIKSANSSGISDLVKQQFEIAEKVLEAGLYPIIEPEVDIKSANKLECEKLLKTELLRNLDELQSVEPVMLKLTIPNEPDFYRDLIEHPKVLRVVALSGGYSRDEANSLLAQNFGLIASFSRALTEGLSAQQTESEFNEHLTESIDSIYKASTTK